MNSESSAIRTAMGTIPERILALLFLVAGGVYLGSSLCAIANFAWLQPLFDQFRLYDIYLSQPFPDNVLQLENGHRPVVPSLLRLAEIHWLQANQLLQIILGASFAAATSLAIAWFGWRSRTLSLAARAASVMLAVIGVFWLANARMLLHGNELVHAYLIMLCLVGGSFCVDRAGSGAPIAWMSLASLCAAVATFSFGPGIAAFPALLFIGWLQRVPWRALALPAATLVICLVLYLFVLPGDQGVRGQLDLRPGAGLAFSARWLSSPWIVAWLGLGDSELYGWAQEFLRPNPLPATLIDLSETTQRWTGLRWTREGGTAIGISGVCLLLFLLAPYLVRRERPGRLECVAICLCLFALATAVIIGFGRLHYLEMFPIQVFADRYLLWPCLYWLGLGLLLLRRLAATARPRQSFAAALFLLVPLIAWPTHALWAGWGATVYRNAQQSAASARSDALDARHFNENAAAGLEVTLRTLNLLRERRLAMFAEPGSDLLGKRYLGHLRDSQRVMAHPLGMEVLRDLRDHRPIARFEGWISSGIKEAQDNGFLAVLDINSHIVGFAEYSFIRPGARSLRFDVPRKRGFDGYIRDYDAMARYRVVVIDGLLGEGQLLYEISP